MSRKAFEVVAKGDGFFYVESTCRCMATGRSSGGIECFDDIRDANRLERALNAAFIRAMAENKIPHPGEVQEK
jgi:hypothetical protein